MEKYTTRVPDVVSNEFLSETFFSVKHLSVHVIKLFIIRVTETIKLLVTSDKNDSGPLKVPYSAPLNVFFDKFPQQFSALVYYSADLSTRQAIFLRG